MAITKCLKALRAIYIAMEETKNQQMTKKVRFDLKDEIFLIPSKWDRLSKCKTARTKVIDEITPNQRSRTVVERRSKKKQNGYRKIPNFDSVAKGKIVLASETNCTVSDNSLRNTSPSKSGSCVRKTASRQKLGGYENVPNGGTSTSPVEAKLKFYHRPPTELPRLDLGVLPKIPYTPDLKKAIEKALQRSRSKSVTDSELNSGASVIQEKKHDPLKIIPTEKAEKVLQRRLSDSSVIIGDEKPTEDKPSCDEGISKFSQLSSINLDGWSPFNAWTAKDSTVRSNRTPPIRRGRSMSSLIPSSILY